jgi:aryl-alcohol dehydrogenase-like predicted oxidoreductase
VQVALAWLLAKPGVTAPIIGATKVSQLDAPIAAVELSLSSEEMSALEAAYVSQPPVGNMPSPSDPPIAAPRA